MKNDPVEWLKSQPHYPKVLWKSRLSNEGVAACGHQNSYDGKSPLFISYDFHRHHSRSFSPRYILRFDEEKSWFETDEPLSLHLAPTPSYSNTLLSRVDLPDFGAWKEAIEAALSAIEKTPLNKVVLARKTTLSFEKTIDPYAYFKTLQSKAQNSTLFLIQWDPSSSFVGATPELLFAREGREITCEALAGTRARGATVEEDEKLAQELLNSEKEGREWGYVKGFLEGILPYLSDSFSETASKQILKTATVQHLYDRFKAHLREGIDDHTLIRLLHPTPAIGGSPTPAALDFIRRHEPFDRGPYSAPIGWLGPDKSELFVAIRCAGIHNNHMDLYAGTGIVAGSDPTSEWDELNSKLHLP